MIFHFNFYQNRNFVIIREILILRGLVLQVKGPQNTGGPQTARLSKCLYICKTGKACWV